jgi:hypothetical protein
MSRPIPMPILPMLMLPALSGCPGVCEGAGCQDLYEQADLLLLSGASVSLTWQPSLPCP